MQNVRLDAAREEVADLLEAQQANPFRVQAYRRAAESAWGRTKILLPFVGSGLLGAGLIWLGIH